MNLHLFCRVSLIFLSDLFIGKTEPQIICLVNNNFFLIFSYILLQMLLILLLCGPAWLALGTEAAPAQRPELVTVALHEGAQGLSFDLFHPQLPINKARYY